MPEVPVLTPEQVRILGVLLEKEILTPEYYPMTVNAIINACNQKTSREPVVAYDEETVEEALAGLRSQGLASVLTGAGHRVAKHSHRISSALNLGRRELAVLCVLMLRGRQTAGELRGRTDRMHDFADLEEVESTLERLMNWEAGPLVARLAARPGHKEPRYLHLLSGPAGAEDAPEEAALEPAPRSAGRVAELEERVKRLEDELVEMRAEFALFRKQFE